MALPIPNLSPPRLALAVFLVLALMLCGLAFGARYAANSSFCGSCHVMQRHVATHARSVHQRASCVDCHSPPGCVACHAADAIDAGLAKKGVNRPAQELHRRHAAWGGTDCAACHDRIMHDRLDGSGAAVDRAVCRRCHGQTHQAAGAG